MKVSKLFEEMKFIDQHGIKQLKSGIGFSEKEQKWYGWSHRAFCGFGIGDKVKEGDMIAKGCEFVEPQYTFEVGHTAKTLDDCKEMAVSFHHSVS
jgi:hypothetical protein